MGIISKLKNKFGKKTTPPPTTTTNLPQSKSPVTVGGVTFGSGGTVTTKDPITGKVTQIGSGGGGGGYTPPPTTTPTTTGSVDVSKEGNVKATIYYDETGKEIGRIDYGRKKIRESVGIKGEHGYRPAEYRGRDVVTIPSDVKYAKLDFGGRGSVEISPTSIVSTKYEVPEPSKSELDKDTGLFNFGNINITPVVTQTGMFKYTRSSYMGDVTIPRVDFFDYSKELFGKAKPIVGKTIEMFTSEPKRNTRESERIDKEYAKELIKEQQKGFGEPIMEQLTIGKKIKNVIGGYYENVFGETALQKNKIVSAFEYGEQGIIKTVGGVSGLLKEKYPSSFGDITIKGYSKDISLPYQEKGTAYYVDSKFIQPTTKIEIESKTFSLPDVQEGITSFGVKTLTYVPKYSLGLFEAYQKGRIGEFAKEYPLEVSGLVLGGMLYGTRYIPRKKYLGLSKASFTEQKLRELEMLNKYQQSEREATIRLQEAVGFGAGLQKGMTKLSSYGFSDIGKYSDIENVFLKRLPAKLSTIGEKVITGRNVNILESELLSVASEKGIDKTLLKDFTLSTQDLIVGSKAKQLKYTPDLLKQVNVNLLGIESKISTPKGSLKSIGVFGQLGSGGKLIKKQVGFKIGEKGFTEDLIVSTAGKKVLRKEISTGGMNFILEEYPFGKPVQSAITKVGKGKSAKINNVLFREYPYQTGLKYVPKQKRVLYGEELNNLLSGLSPTKEKYSSSLKFQKKYMSDIILMQPQKADIQIDVTSLIGKGEKVTKIQRQIKIPFLQYAKENIKEPKQIFIPRRTYSLNLPPPSYDGNQIVKQIQKSKIIKSTPTISSISPKISKPQIKTVLTVSKPSFLQENLPLMVGGTGLRSIPFEGKNVYETSISFGRLVSEKKESDYLIPKTYTPFNGSQFQSLDLRIKQKELSIQKPLSSNIYKNNLLKKSIVSNIESLKQKQNQKQLSSLIQKQKQRSITTLIPRSGFKFSRYPEVTTKNKIPKIPFLFPKLEFEILKSKETKFKRGGFYQPSIAALGLKGTKYQLPIEKKVSPLSITGLSTRFDVPTYRIKR